MATEVIMPKVDMVTDAGTFVEWLRHEGEHVEKGDPLFVVLTDKANIEIEAPASGVLAGVSAKPVDVIPVTEVIAYILEPGESLPTGTDSSPQAAATPRCEDQGEPAAQTQPELFATKAASVSGAGDGKVRATPAARRLAAERGIDS